MAQGETLSKILPSVSQFICVSRYASVPYVIYWVVLWLAFKAPDVAYSSPEALDELSIDQETPHGFQLVEALWKGRYLDVNIAIDDICDSP